MQSSTLVDQVIYIRYSSLFQEKKKYAKLYGKDTFCERNSKARRWKKKKSICFEAFQELEEEEIQMTRK